jgi:hypothetical protein
MKITTKRKKSLITFELYQYQRKKTDVINCPDTRKGVTIIHCKPKREFWEQIYTRIAIKTKHIDSMLLTP